MKPVRKFQRVFAENLIKLLRNSPIYETTITHTRKFGYFFLTPLEGVQESGYFDCTDFPVNHKLHERDWIGMCFVQFGFFRKKIIINAITVCSVVCLRPV
jgi:hypothetical protein